MKVSLHRPAGGDQDLNLYMRDSAEVIQELIADVKAPGKQYFVFKEYQNNQGSWVQYISVCLEEHGLEWSGRSHEEIL